ncbi:terminase large subunit, partial [Weissella sp. MSCH1]
LYILEATGKTGMLNGEIAQMIKDLGHSKETIIADAAEPKSIAEIRKAGIDRITKARKGPDSIRHGIEYLQQFKIVVDERLFQVIEELDNYTWQKDKKTGEYINKPVDSFNHFLDAVRYAADKQSLKSADSFEQKLRKARTYFG